MITLAGKFFMLFEKKWSHIQIGGNTPIDVYCTFPRRGTMFVGRAFAGFQIFDDDPQ